MIQSKLYKLPKTSTLEGNTLITPPPHSAPKGMGGGWGTSIPYGLIYYLNWNLKRINTMKKGIGGGWGIVLNLVLVRANIKSY